MTRLKFWRLQEHITQLAAAERLGIGVSAYALIELGRMGASRAQRAALVAAFGIKADTILESVSEITSAT